MVTGTLEGGGDVDVYAGATLGGTGDITGSVINNTGGTIAPGLSPGCLSTGNLTLNGTSTLSMEINGATACTQYDRIEVSGTVNLGGATLNLTGGFVAGPGTELIIINNDSTDAVVGTFAGLPEGAPVSAGAFSGQITYVGGDGNDVSLTAAGLVGDSSDAGGGKKDSYTPDETVYAIGSGFTPQIGVNIYVVPDRAWTDGDPIGVDISNDGMNAVNAGTTGDIGPIPIWDPSLVVGEYDIVFDSQSPTGAPPNGQYDLLWDYVDDVSPAGFIVIDPGGEPGDGEPAHGGPTVGGEVMFVNKVQLVSQLMNLPIRLMMGLVL